MPCWYFDKKELRDTPTIQDGIAFETERRYRKEGARFIMTCGTQMGLGHNTIATGVVYFHRFYMFHSFKSFPRYVTACCCLLLAGKVEETPKKCRDIISTARTLLSDNYFYSFGKDPKEEVMTLERILLQTIKFDLQVEHPYTFLLKYAKCFKGDQQKLQKMVQMAWNFVNDSLSTVVCLQWEPEIIAVALIYLASKLSKFIVIDWVGRQPQHLRWWDMFVSDVTMEILEDICHQVLDLYQSNQKDTLESQSPPQKPPSRADSPTPTKGIACGSSSDSPTNKTKTTTAVTTTTATVTNTVTGIQPVAIVANSMSELNNIQAIKSLGNQAPSAPIPAALPPPTIVVGPGTGDGMPAAAIVPPPGVGTAYHHHMYGAPPPPLNPHPIHALTMYGSGPAPPPPPPHGYGAAPPCSSVPSNAGNGNTAPPPLPPQMTSGYGAPPNANTWPGAATGMPNAHYPAVPPPPMPPTGPPPSTAGSGGYYQGPYGRQQQQRY